MHNFQANYDKTLGALDQVVIKIMIFKIDT